MNTYVSVHDMDSITLGKIQHLVDGTFTRKLMCKKDYTYYELTLFSHSKKVLEFDVAQEETK